jgi:uncharacterized membrane protein (UPF0127 family)
MDKRILAILFLLLCSAIFVAYLRGNFSSAKAIGSQVRIGSAMYQVEVAATSAAQSKGLSGRPSLAAGQGMLFPFSPPRSEVFWMYQMNFPIDIVWIRDGKVVGFVERAPVPTTVPPATFPSPGIVDYVLEVPAGTVAADHIMQGATVEILGYTK